MSKKNKERKKGRKKQMWYNGHSRSVRKNNEKVRERGRDISAVFGPTISAIRDLIFKGLRER